MRQLSSVFVFVYIATTVGPACSQTPGDRPSDANSAIAARYPGDVGIASDERVVFVETFDDSIASVTNRWESVKAKECLSLASDIPDNSTGKTSLLVTHTGGRGDAVHLYRRLMPGHQKLHYRFYVKFDVDCAPIHHFFHVGGYHPATAWPQGGAGDRPRGNERFTTGVEPFGNDWRWDFYSYWMEMRGSPPRGQCWGNSFIHDRSPVRIEEGPTSNPVRIADR